MTGNNISAHRVSRLATKLIGAGALDRADAPVLDGVLTRDVRAIDAGVPVFGQGERPAAIDVLLEGWAVRERTLPDGRRQIVGILCAGDVCDFNAFMMAHADSGCRAIGPARIGRIGRQSLSQLNQRHPAIGHALWWESMLSASIQRDWAANLAARKAEPRIAGLLCGLLARATLVDLVNDAGTPWPFTQSDLANACGVTTEHLNRTLGSLKRRGLIRIDGGAAYFPDPHALAAVAQFDPAPLHGAADALPFVSPPEHDGAALNPMAPPPTAPREVAPV